MSPLHKGKLFAASRARRRLCSNQSGTRIAACLSVTDKPFFTEDRFHGSKQFAFGHCVFSVALHAEAKRFSHHVFWSREQACGSVERLRSHVALAVRCPAESNPASVPPLSEPLPIH